MGVDAVVSDAHFGYKIFVPKVDLSSAGQVFDAVGGSALGSGVGPVPGNAVKVTLTAKNSGNGALSGVAFTPTLAGLSPLTVAWPDTSKPGTIPVGESAVAVGWYVLTQADIDAGVVATSATVAGSDPLGQAASSSSSVSVPLASTPALKISSSWVFQWPGLGWGEGVLVVSP